MNRILIFFLCLMIIIPTVVYFSLRDNNIKLNGTIEDDNFESPKENKLNFLWSKGLWEKSDYVFAQTESKSEDFIENQLSKDVIWIRTTSRPITDTCDLDIFSNNLDKLTKPVILVSSDGDKSIPSDLKQETYEKIINSDKIKRWYTQNYDGSKKDEKLRPYPIGFDLHTERTYFGFNFSFLMKKPVTEKINYLLGIRKRFSNKTDKIFCDVHLSPNKKFNNERTRVKQILNSCESMEFLKTRTDQKSIWNKYASHKFVISTFGNGLDCHRTWEILFLGGIVITKTSSLDPLFENLPVAIVKDWDECLDKNNLIKWENQLSHLTDYDHINKFYKYDHWI